MAVAYTQSNMKEDLPVAGWTFNIWHDKIARIIIVLVVLAAIASALWPGVISITLLVLLVIVLSMILYFFRNPRRTIVDEPGVVIGPGDGKIVAITSMHEDRYLHADTIRISIFLSVLDVHVQRAPVGGEIILVEHRPGKFLQAFRPEASDVNERISMVIDSRYGRILVQQIAGILARRCINFTQPGESIRIGQRYGLIKFGSRVDLYLPPEAEILVDIEDQVHGGLTPVARFGGQSGE
jgi:phosphatidylserine decarboxylase